MYSEIVAIFGLVVVVACAIVFSMQLRKQHRQRKKDHCCTVCGLPLKLYAGTDMTGQGRMPIICGFCGECRFIVVLNSDWTAVD